MVSTEHFDFEQDWLVDDGDIGEHGQKYVDETGHVRLPPFDVEGYLEAVEHCRHQYPDLKILTGIEFGQPHVWEGKAAATALLSSGVIVASTARCTCFPSRAAIAQSRRRSIAGNRRIR